MHSRAIYRNLLSGFLCFGVHEHSKMGFDCTRRLGTERKGLGNGTRAQASCRELQPRREIVHGSEWGMRDLQVVLELCRIRRENHCTSDSRGHSLVLRVVFLRASEDPSLEAHALCACVCVQEGKSMVDEVCRNV